MQFVGQCCYSYSHVNGLRLSRDLLVAAEVVVTAVATATSTAIASTSTSARDVFTFTDELKKKHTLFLLFTI